MRVAYRCIVFFIHLDGLVGLCCDKSALGVVECASEDSRLAVQGARLHGCMDALEVVAGPPVPHVDGAVISYSEEEEIQRVSCYWARS